MMLAAGHSDRRGALLARARGGVMLVTDGRGEADRLRALVAAALRGGVRAVQLREPTMSARGLAALCAALLPGIDEVGALLMVNDRADIAAAGLAHGVQLGYRSLSPVAARRFLPATALIGCSAHDQDAVGAASAAGADFVTLSPVFPTACKPGAAAMGPQRAAAIAAAAAIPVVWLGGVGGATVAQVAPYCPFAVAAMAALCDAADPSAAAAELIGALRTAAKQS